MATNENNNNSNSSSSDITSDKNNNEEDAIRLGFVEEVEGEGVDYFSNKVGGKPVWLNPEILPPPLFCSRCNKPLVFLLQIYAPLDRFTHAYHRSFYLFCCLDGSCGTYNVVRVQLPQENKYYDADGKLNEKVARAPLCLCGSFGEKRCSRCKKVFYCSKEHQAVDWTRHKKECEEAVTSLAGGESSEKKSTNTESTAKNAIEHQTPIFLFKEMEIITMEEPEEDDVENEKDEDSSEDRKELLQKYQEYLNREKSEGSVSLEELPEMGSFTDGIVKQDHDPIFLKFQKRITREKEQILRYTDRLFTQPLFVGEKGKPNTEDIPSCSHCGAQRSFEFQVLPQLLYYLDVEKVLKRGETPIIDWGTLIVYTCSNSCDGKNYYEEFVWKQDF